MTDHAAVDIGDVLTRPVFAGGRSKPFAELTAAEVKERADELRGVTGWGPTAKVASVARAWSELGRAMDQGDIATVGDLDREAVAQMAQRLWVVPPGGSLL